jgi:hypothetical protein
MAHLILYTDSNFLGEHKHVLDKVDALSLLGTDSQGQTVCVADCGFPNGVSSIVILSGNWQFSRGEKQQDPYPVILGPGLYRFVGDYKLVNDQIRAMQPVDQEPTMPGEALNGYVTLFEHANFRGHHLHLFEGNSDLDADYGFAKKASSLVVELGNWSFFFDTQSDGSYPGSPVVGPGIWSWVEDLGIGDNTISSLALSTSPATVSNSVDNPAVLFVYRALYGAHRHIFAAEPNLNADDDDSFNDNVGSLAVLAGDWSFYSDANFHGLYGSYGTPVVPGNYPDLTQLSIPYFDMSSLRPAIPTDATSGTGILGHVILFQEPNFQGSHKHVFNSEGNLNADEDNDFDDSVSSIVVISGNWKFYRNWHWDDDYPVTLGPGLYPRVEDVAIRDKDMSSLQVVDQEPTVSAAPVAAHIMLFEYAQFRGSHKHVFQQLDLGAGDDNSFDNITSSIVVLAGTWWTYGDPGQQRQFKPFLGPGLYPTLDSVNIPDNDLTSLSPSDTPPSVLGQQILGQALLFEHATFRGAHKHIFNAESDLNNSDDDSFNDATSSIVVLQNIWWTFRDSGFLYAYDVTLGQGLFPGVEQVGVANDDLSSLEVAGLRLAFSGMVTVNIKSGNFPDPITHTVDMTFIFHPDSEEGLEIEHGFEAFDLPFTVDTITPTVTYGGAVGGTFHRADGSVLITAVTIDISAGITISLTFALTTGTAAPNSTYMITGVPFMQDPNSAKIQGTITLVGTGRESGSGDDYQVVIEGSWAEV